MLISTYEFLVLTTVVHRDVRLAGLVGDLEREMLEIRLDLRIGELATDEPFGVEYARKSDLGYA